MADKSTDKELCAALSDLFIDNEINYQYIARTAINFELPHVEDVLLEWVAPVFWHNFFAIVFEWAGYNSDSVWEEVGKVLIRDSNPSLLWKIFLKIRRKFMAYMLKEKWNALVTEYNKQRSARDE